MHLTYFLSQSAKIDKACRSLTKSHPLFCPILSCNRHQNQPQKNRGELNKHLKRHGSLSKVFRCDLAAHIAHDHLCLEYFCQNNCGESFTSASAESRHRWNACTAQRPSGAPPQPHYGWNEIVPMCIEKFPDCAIPNYPSSVPLELDIDLLNSDPAKEHPIRPYICKTYLYIPPSLASSTPSSTHTSTSTSTSTLPPSTLHTPSTSSSQTTLPATPHLSPSTSSPATLDSSPLASPGYPAAARPAYSYTDKPAPAAAYEGGAPACSPQGGAPSGYGVHWQYDVARYPASSDAAQVVAPAQGAYYQNVGIVAAQQSAPAYQPARAQAAHYGYTADAVHASPAHAYGAQDVDVDMAQQSAGAAGHASAYAGQQWYPGDMQGAGTDQGLDAEPYQGYEDARADGYPAYGYGCAQSMDVDMDDGAGYDARNTSMNAYAAHDGYVHGAYDAGVYEYAEADDAYAAPGAYANDAYAAPSAYAASTTYVAPADDAYAAPAAYASDAYAAPASYTAHASYTAPTTYGYEQPAASYGSQHPEAPYGHHQPAAAAPYGYQQPEAPYGSQHLEAPYGSQHPTATYSTQHPTAPAPYGYQQPAAEPQHPLVRAAIAQLQDLHALSEAELQRVFWEVCDSLAPVRIAGAYTGEEGRWDDGWVGGRR
ncbi:hypothetical protein DENSPDRAFT_852121 [Dentipellis sp. KUC8613]|nr:hypothetical protein DENSPDRAFT_852121 [Dentipellis sp. KUC8613]